MRLLFTYDIFIQQAYGGASGQFLALQRSLRQLGVNAVIASPFWLTRNLRHGPGVPGCRIPGRLGVRGMDKALRAFADPVERLALRSLRNSGDEFLVHRTNYSLRSFPNGLPVVTTLYDMIHEDHPEYFPGSNTQYAKVHCLTTSDGILAISAYTKERLLDHYDVDPTRVEVTPLGVTRVAPDPVALRSLRKSSPFLLYVGARAAYKNFHRMIQAYAMSGLRQDGLELVAFGGGRATDAEQRFISDHGLSSHVHFRTGSDSFLAAHYAAADALVYPSLDEGFGLPPLEAMLHMCPVAAANAGAIPEIVGDAALLFDPLSIDSIARALIEITNDAALGVDLTRRGVSRCRNFTHFNQALSTLDAYKRVLSRKGH